MKMERNRGGRKEGVRDKERKEGRKGWGVGCGYVGQTSDVSRRNVAVHPLRLVY